MIKMLLAVLFLFSVAQAAQPTQLAVQVDGAVYSCVGQPTVQPVDCNKAAAAFDSMLKSCMTSYSGGACAQHEMPKFKKAYPSCVLDVLTTCQTACEITYSSAACTANICTY